ncbi:MAG: helix-turn-helix domain-containing protein [Chloroflexi bacterium]|nr:helix-turn-helix domain-containing protein [Chloroflexota bacterium]
MQTDGQMTPYERVMTVLALGQPDRVPVVPISKVTGIKSAYYTYRDSLAGVREIARNLGLAKSTAHRLLTALECVRNVEQDAKTGKYRAAGLAIVSIK